MEKTFVRVRSVKDITIFTLLIVSGVVLVGLPASTPVNITGFFLIFTGLVLAFILKSGYKDTESGSKFQKKEYYFQQAMNAPLSAAIISNPESIDLSEEGKGNTVRLDIYYSKSTQMAYVQLFEYIPYKYEPCSMMYEHGIEKVAGLIK